jgi:hypothetical protein
MEENNSLTGPDAPSFSFATMTDNAAIVAYYLMRFREGDVDAAFHGLLDQEHAILPDLAEAFRVSTDASLRVFLLNVIWQHRQQSAVPVLAEALFDSQPEIWKEAMDGLVALASLQSLEALCQARSRTFEVDRDRLQFCEWLEEAIEQTQAQLKS